MNRALEVPITGEVVDLKEASLPALAATFDGLAQFELQIRSAKRELSDEVARRLDFFGRRSYEQDGWRLEVNAPTERDYDIDELRATLAELVAEGTISDEKAKAVIRWTPEVVWSELKPLTTDPRCAERINHTISVNSATRYARVKKGKGEV
jgi:hypothetical protein